jgi:hypothetical protein
MSTLYYLVKGSLYRSKDNEENLIEINEVFKNDSPILARERAFEVYQNYIDVLLESKGLTYEDHRDAVAATKDFIKGEQPVKNNFIEGVFGDIQNDFDKGISVYLVMSNSKTFTTLEGELIYEDKILIHDLNSEINGLKEAMYQGLTQEYELYKQQGYDCKDYTAAFPCAEKSTKNKYQTILRTPINHVLDSILKHI